MKSIFSHKSLLFWFITVLLFENGFAQVQSVFPKNAWGSYSWTQFTGLTKQNAPDAKGGPIVAWWSKLETADGVYQFDKEIGDKLKTLEQNDMYCFLIVWVAPAGDVLDGTTKWRSTPQWIFNSPHDVPLVEFDERTDPLGKEQKSTYPYYLDQTYTNLYYRMIRALGNYITNLPPNLRSRILYIQSAEGATGDGQPYKGKPINPIYDITNARWETYRIDAWKVYKEALSKDGNMLFPLLTNDDSNSAAMRKWMLDELPNAVGVKNGMFSHGYQISDAQERVKAHFALRDQVTAAGKEFFARGEQDMEYVTHGWSTKNVPQGLYWSAIYATHCGLGMWNAPTQAFFEDPKNLTAFKFFNKYAAQFYPESAKGAFCAFYRGLDASDGITYPEVRYGKVHRKTLDRYSKICQDFAAFGAKMEDAAAASSSGMGNRASKGYNDAGWQILTTNFERHLSQIEPEATSQAWWDVDPSIYGRFARGFKAGSNAMYFNLNDKFFGSTPLNGAQEIELSITYRDSDIGSWELQYDAVGGTMKKALTISNSGTGTNVWKTANVTIADAYLGNRGQKGSDFMLVNTGGTSCRFHMIEVRKSKDIALSKQDFTENVKFSIVQDFVSNTIKVSSQNKLASIAVFDLTGKQIQNHVCNDELFTVDTNKMNSGIYIISIKDHLGNSKNEKFIIK